MSSAVESLTREQKIERYVVRDALETFLGNFFVEGGWCQEAPITLASEESLQEILTELTGKVSYELWPADDLLDGRDYRCASVKSAALVTRMFAELAAAEPSWAAERAAAYAERVAKTINDEQVALPGKERKR